VRGHRQRARCHAERPEPRRIGHVLPVDECERRRIVGACHHGGAGTIGGGDTHGLVIVHVMCPRAGRDHERALHGAGGDHVVGHTQAVHVRRVLRIERQHATTGRQLQVRVHLGECARSEVLTHGGGAHQQVYLRCIDAGTLHCLQGGACRDGDYRLARPQHAPVGEPVEDVAIRWRVRDHVRERGVVVPANDVTDGRTRAGDGDACAGAHWRRPCSVVGVQLSAVGACFHAGTGNPR